MNQEWHIPPMEPTLTSHLPLGSQWWYEPKFDGFRMQLVILKESIHLMSKTGVFYTHAFPDIINAAKQLQAQQKELLPLVFDGELCVLLTSLRCDFSALATRARMTNTNRIHSAASKTPATLCLFDVLVIEGAFVGSLPYDERKELLTDIKMLHQDRIVRILSVSSSAQLLSDVRSQHGEGIVAKKSNSLYTHGRTTDWVKYKTYQTVMLVLSSPSSTGYFSGRVLNEDGQWSNVCTLRHGMTAEEAAALTSVLKANKEADGVCAEVHTIGMADGMLREPRFVRFLPEESPQHCTMNALQKALTPKTNTDVSKPAKLLWPTVSISKSCYMSYMETVAEAILPHLQKRILTVVRWPDGVGKTSFYQRNKPAYAPTVVGTPTSDADGMLCNTKKALLWFANHAALEFHVPFHQDGDTCPRELVFDLDPPDVSSPSQKQTVSAALWLKEILDSFSLMSFVKSSGNKGLQVYVPLQEERHSYATVHKFMKLCADVLAERHEDKVTVERFIQQRKGRLYVDYVQHHPKKTIIAPYSCRGNQEGYVAAPLEWDELSLTDSYLRTQHRVMQAVNSGFLPFATMNDVRQKNSTLLMKITETLEQH
ncbi:DNA ligase D [Aureibacillus halotolerans]|uniref:Bifunctional non-homologous end joining protein LigD n=1 Tax=Aureibacillus halotolerans TaxID=1508390 RepID=A0A4R6U9X1_9BACI|nr:DNA ligase D [Aureibacillus halotolerans]TDQ41485.1 bifunctional non-homologous end joining protein LigD [Aureibacillus halotolerans]